MKNLIQTNLLAPLSALNLSKTGESEFYFEAEPGNKNPLDSLNPTYILRKAAGASEQIKAAFKNMENVAELSPVDFQHAQESKNIYALVQRFAENGLVSEAKLKKMLRGVKDPKPYYDIASAMNAQRLLEENYFDLVSTFLQSLENGNLYYTFENSRGERYVVNKKYLLALFKENNIVGAETEDGKFVIFDKAQVKTKSEVESQRKNLQEEFASVREVFAKYLEKNANLTAEILKNGSPSEIMDYISKTSIGALYEKSAGNWEGFTIKEHTESVLRWFFDKYKNELDCDLATLMTFLLVAHDMGKGIAVEHHEKDKQDNYNYAEAKKWFSSLDFPKPVQDILLFVIKDGETYTSKYYVHGQTNIKEQFAKDAAQVFESAFGTSLAPAEVNGLWKICTILQSCDSGAYTRYGVSRRFGGYHYNGNDKFTKSFETKRVLDVVNPDIKEPN